MSDEKKFYVLRAISGKENQVKQYIEAEKRNSSLGEHVDRVIIPTEKVMTQRAGKKVLVERPLLSGYILVEANLVGEVAHTLRTIPNVIDFLGDGRNPVPLRESEVNQMLGKADQLDDSDVSYDVDFVVGETVKVISGAFGGFTASVEDVNADKKRLKVMVKIFGRKTPLELDYSQVEKE
ncbi:antitermination protein NusG [Porphyromonas crevioricanis]|uniref:Transcription termination/antitermination protein NusG n=2 Tax=Porphyromonas crevioricanis TaxID=393921 RepID=A0AB34PF50_9PORP|nr:transcription termination/antitermination protein NusG [Porphyromonas crevioricanis]KGN89646.1 antitermination protein NusG [Porphyromonas crevioricanis]KGN93799.1 antitermination protein NusG [Porphyromonas crevioricanis]GAD04702.1 transcription antitermination protein NusG [Porphyromonas crevioricanis JCM 15906]SJZ79124.1 transcription antitermination protein nusG [Porphyromonas crevioricanis]